MCELPYVRYTYIPPETYARFTKFSTTGTSNPQLGFSAPLGLRQTGPAGIVNAVELRFDVHTDVFEEYRLRRIINREEAWQKLGRSFSRFHRKYDINDGPPQYGARQFQPPDIYDYDSPGLEIRQLQNRSISISGDLTSDPAASEIAILMNFHEYVEGRSASNWRRISLFTYWHSLTWVIWNTALGRWTSSPRMTAGLGIAVLREAGDTLGELRIAS